MENQRFTVTINAPRHTVWTTMLEDATYREWTGAFHEGSYYEGSWNLNEVIRFLGPSSEGEGLGGMAARVVANRPDEFVSLEYYGLVFDGRDDTESDDAKQLVGAHENYTFEETDGVTLLTVDLEGPAEYAEMFEDMWPKALNKLREVAEARVREDA